MIKIVLMALLLLGLLIGPNVGTAYAKGPPPDTRGYDEYIEHAGPGTPADDPLDIAPPPDDGTDPGDPGGGI